MLFIDADHFKRYNDAHGHAQGDVALQYLAQCISKHARRRGDLAARYGGEEMAMLLPGIDVNEAAKIGQTIRTAVESAVFPTRKHDLKITISIGVATFPDHAQSVEELIAQADQGLYEAKRRGRNRLVYLATRAHCSNSA